MPAWLSHLVPSATEADHSLPVVLGLALAAACLLLVWVVMNLRRAQERIAALELERREAADAQRGAVERERKQGKQLETRRGEVEELKLELGSQKKKNHAAQEEVKKLRADLRERIDELARVRAERPAFESKPKPEEPKQVAKPPPPPPPVKVEPTPSATENEALKQVVRLEEDKKILRERLEAERLTVAQAQDELSRLRKRVEDYRRIDIIGKGRTAVLEDRLGLLGRQYYDAVSELAVLKGEVKPPRPRELSQRVDDGAEDTSAESDMADDAQPADDLTELPEDNAADVAGAAMADAEGSEERSHGGGSTEQ